VYKSREIQQVSNLNSDSCISREENKPDPEASGLITANGVLL
jgi:hypothetical protein